MNDTACSPAPTTRVKWGRIICLAGALGLCVSFFLPQIPYYVAHGGAKGHSEATAPIQLVTRDVLFVVVYGLPFLAAILLLPLLTFRAVTREDAVKGVGSSLAWAECAICLSVLIVGLGRVSYLFIAHMFLGAGGVCPIGYALSAVSVTTLALAVVSLVRNPLPRKVAAVQFALWTYCLAYVAYVATVWFTFMVIFAGMCLSLAACAALVIGSAIDWFQCRPSKETLR